ncbi:hypothetical protein VCHC51A1_3728 [Vibrio cholerae HC-51A1]|nr:hypothetical protein VCHC02A1_3651 [Vibrio cholerae HC-02A1]EKG45572.1 hypothetical protein VCHC50A1_3695 [Vibrio cholerae HC-50A1]EKG61669.1 hypothetical protein VCHC52A1_3756 [Vibrio cholerae HC-52A1]EKG65943.1 hypothetical protein VCHC55A1_3783 [Vibrio cholerae HC-55A1]EKG66044.1 hypothetical protein VCHC56A1_3667 [Vibrio cholerae HC-56A1]EKG66888.1 hypothetical protein VCHC57A1_3600 [Vibrio cholerae HC-57A1]EKG86073.1 hypothetical protein VCHC51A1_3728 [Vibrio cholerae HC-51A1]EKK9280
MQLLHEKLVNKVHGKTLSRNKIQTFIYLKPNKSVGKY